MADKIVLIVSNSIDPHVEDMIAYLNYYNQKFVRLNSNDIPQNIRFHLQHHKEIDASGHIQVSTNNVKVSLQEIKSVWWRRPKAFILPEGLSSQEKAFSQQELDHVWDGLWATVDTYWISLPSNIKNASNKYEQLKRAELFGLDTPKTIISNNYFEIQEFFSSIESRIAYKVLTDPFLAMNKSDKPLENDRLPKAVRTTIITEKHIEKLGEQLLIPCLFQEYIEKHSEFRVTIIGDDIFVAEIFSQEHPKTSVDFRHFDVPITYKVGQLSDEILNKCVQFVKSYNLNFSTMDLILTPEGRVVFLENNPNGQFIFIEKRLPQLRMTDALASRLIKGKV